MLFGVKPYLILNQLIDARSWLFLFCYKTEVKAPGLETRIFLSMTEDQIQNHKSF